MAPNRPLLEKAGDKAAGKFGRYLCFGLCAQALTSLINNDPRGARRFAAFVGAKHREIKISTASLAFFLLRLKHVLSWLSKRLLDAADPNSDEETAELLPNAKMTEKVTKTRSA